jgi:hypothetical protein
MLRRLHKRRGDGRRGEGRGAVRGLSCDETGLYFAGDCALIEGVAVDGGRVYRRRPMEAINRALSAGYAARSISPRGGRRWTASPII